MKESVVLLMSLTPTCTELARHLVLAGINLCILKDKSPITEDDIENDFLMCQKDLGQNVSKHLKKILFVEM
jgi:molybdopterin/thiamine biosynthesis adenylyltransferase